MPAKEENAFTSITIYYSDYEQLQKIAKSNGYLNEKNQPSMRETVRHLLKNFEDKIA